MKTILSLMFLGLVGCVASPDYSAGLDDSEEIVNQEPNFTQPAQPHLDPCPVDHKTVILGDQVYTIDIPVACRGGTVDLFDPPPDDFVDPILPQESVQVQ